MYTIEISTVKQKVKTVHVGELDSILKKNRLAALMGGDLTWVIVDTADSMEEAGNKAAFWNGVMCRRWDSDTDDRISRHRVLELIQERMNQCSHSPMKDEELGAYLAYDYMRDRVRAMT